MEMLTTVLLIAAVFAVGLFLVIKGFRGARRTWPVRRSGEGNEDWHLRFLKVCTKIYIRWLG